jgi:competence protein ComGC
MSEEQKKKLSGLAIASLVCGCLFVLPFSLIAFILGIVALVIISKNEETIKGKGLAIAGIVLGSVGMFVLPIIAVVVALFIPMLLMNSQKAETISVKAALHSLANACEYYYVDNNEYPKSIDDLIKAAPPYLEEESIDLARKKYTFDCKAQDFGSYACSATPLKCVVGKNKIFKIDSTFEISEEDCKN